MRYLLHLLVWLDDLSCARAVRRRDRSDSGERMTVEELAASFGIDPKQSDPNPSLG